VHALVRRQSRHQTLKGNINKEPSKISEDDLGVGAPKYCKTCAEICESPSVFECLEWNEAKFLRRTTATLQQLTRVQFFCFLLGLDLIEDFGSGGGIEPPTLGL
jgi:hypothetical protein